MEEDPRVTVWCWAVDDLDDPLREELLSLLTDDERARHDRFIVPSPRVQFVAARATLRRALSLRHPEVDPRAWRFAENAHGRPHLTGPVLGAHFNVSHTPGMVVVALSDDPDVGVDVEAASRASDALKIADRFFSPDEVRDLRALPEAQQRDRFFDLWTLKESYIKARGMGLAISLSRFSFSFPDNAVARPSQPTLRCDPGLDDGARWWSLCADRGDGFRVSLTVAHRGAPVRVRWRDVAARGALVV